MEDEEYEEWLQKQNELQNNSELYDDNRLNITYHIKNNSNGTKPNNEV